MCEAWTFVMYYDDRQPSDATRTDLNRNRALQKYEQGMDLEGKEEGSDETMRAAAATMCDNYRALVGLQKWRKEEQGDTMGTCDVR